MILTSLRHTLIWLTPLLATAAGWLAHRSGLPAPASITLAIGLLTAIWWMTEAVPIGAASLVPIALLPLFGILKDKTDVAQSYGHPLILLLMGGFLLSKGMEKSGVHRRLALAMVRLCGGNGGRGLVLGFMLASAILSMWISNTATCLMLLPIALAVLDGAKTEDATTSHLAAPLMLGIAFASNIGGVGTPIGTPPNLVFIEQYQQTTGKLVTFSGWMKIGLPIIITLLPLMWLWLTRHVGCGNRLKLPQCGPWSAAEVRTLAVFAFTALAWITRSEPNGGWSQWLNLTGANDASVAFVGVLLMFAIPDGTGRAGPEGRLLDWENAARIPWGILLLFSGGICLATGFEKSGLSGTVAGLLSGVGSLPTWAVILTVCLVMTFLTELTSNTASTILMMPILAAAGLAAGVDPIYLMLPAAISASCAFMLPVATGPNAVVFASGHFPVARMAREGFVLNLIAAAVVTFWVWLLG
ncbi:MAG: SLC13/DASS family transporter [Verrucomicrobiales bacterium]|nr:SLC13/DASS family transporter [Verrucomicrobiales bacterium]